MASKNSVDVADLRFGGGESLTGMMRPTFRASTALHIRSRPLSRQFQYLCRRLAFQGGGNPAANHLSSAPERIVIKVSIALGRARLRMAKQLSDDWKTQTAAGTVAGVGVPQIVKANTIQASA